MPAQPISKAQFERLENEWRQMREGQLAEAASNTANPSPSTPRK